MTADLLRWAEDQFWQAKEVNRHGIRQADVARHIEKTTGRRLARREACEKCPSCLYHVWEWFLLLAERYCAFDEQHFPTPSHWVADLIALTGLNPHAEEIRILGKLFSCWWAAKNK